MKVGIPLRLEVESVGRRAACWRRVRRRLRRRSRSFNESEHRTAGRHPQARGRPSETVGHFMQAVRPGSYPQSLLLRRRARASSRECARLRADARLPLRSSAAVSWTSAESPGSDSANTSTRPASSTFPGVRKTTTPVPDQVVDWSRMAQCNAVIRPSRRRSIH